MKEAGGDQAEQANQVKMLKELFKQKLT